MFKVYIKRVGLVKEELVAVNILEYLKRYKNIERNNQSLHAWFLLQEVLLQDYSIDISQKQIKLTKNAKPMIDGISFSISHSHDLVCLIVSNHQCGIDIEKIDQTIKHDKLASKVLTDDEFSKYQNTTDKLDYFVKQWTKKEAYLKCFNDGITSINSLKIKKNVKTIKVSDYLNHEYYVSYITK